MSTSDVLPDLGDFLNCVLAELQLAAHAVDARLHGSPASDMLDSLPPSTRYLVLTLHSLLPSTLLPALDLLDRGLVTHCLLEEYGSPGLYYVISAKPAIPKSRYGGTSSTPKYEVRTTTWSCTCAGFTFAAFNSEGSGTSEPMRKGYLSLASGKWGGSALDESNSPPPICKHLVACMLAEKCRALFGHHVKDRILSTAEIAEMAVVWD